MRERTDHPPMRIVDRFRRLPRQRVVRVLLMLAFPTTTIATFIGHWLYRRFRLPVRPCMLAGPGLDDPPDPASEGDRTRAPWEAYSDRLRRAARTSMEWLQNFVTALAKGLPPDAAPEAAARPDEAVAQPRETIPPHGPDRAQG